MTAKTFTIEKVYTERNCFHDHFNSYPCDPVPEIIWMVTNNVTGEKSDYGRKKDAVDEVAQQGGTVSEIVTWS